MAHNGFGKDDKEVRIIFEDHSSMLGHACGNAAFREAVTTLLHCNPNAKVGFITCGGKQRQIAAFQRNLYEKEPPIPEAYRDRIKVFPTDGSISVREKGLVSNPGNNA